MIDIKVALLSKAFSKLEMIDYGQYPCVGHKQYIKKKMTDCSSSLA